MFRRLTVLGGALALAAGALMSGPLGAHATAPEVPPLPADICGVAIPPPVPPPVPLGCSDVIALVGEATIITDSDADTPASVEQVGGSGTYSFTSTACVGASDSVQGTADLPPPVFVPAEVSPCTITSTGSFMNDICGTGTANSSSTTGGPILGLPITTDQITGGSYNIWFDAGIGVIEGSISSNSPDGGTPLAPVQTSDGSESFLGVVLLGPSTTASTHDVNDTTDCVQGFTIVAVILANEDGTS